MASFTPYSADGFHGPFSTRLVTGVMAPCKPKAPPRPYTVGGTPDDSRTTR
jgi:hypothetical protein